MTDPIADMLTRMRNALRVSKSEVAIPYSRIKVNLAEILKQEGYISSYTENKDLHELRIQLKYEESGEPTMQQLKRISTPGRRVYSSTDKLPRVLNNLGIAIVSTPEGLMTAATAKKRKIGGEIICEIY
jgi:small subunit ribosomal protein S8